MQVDPTLFSSSCGDGFKLEVSPGFLFEASVNGFSENTSLS